MARSSARGAAVTRLRVHEVARVLVGDRAWHLVGASRGRARRRTPARRASSRRTRARVRCTRSRRASSSAYSFIVEPQPAELTITASTPAARNASMLRRASSRARTRSPAWRLSAPQHVCSDGNTDAIAEAVQHAHRRLVRAGVEVRHHAAGEQRDAAGEAAAAAPAAETATRGSSGSIAPPRRGAREQAQDARRTEQRAQRRALVQPQRRSSAGRGAVSAAGCWRSAATRRRHASGGLPSSTLARAVSMMRPNGTPDGHAVSQARHWRQRSRCCRSGGCRLRAPGRERIDQGDAAARRVGLHAEFEVGRACLQAEAAVHAPGDVLGKRRGGAVSVLLRRLRHYSPPHEAARREDPLRIELLLEPSHDREVRARWPEHVDHALHAGAVPRQRRRSRRLARRRAHAR